ncbi:hypothetical protein MLD38_032948 [Melastoma candidum]|uniref:Uncharacterized protein n=1 Tax=Melastoma candidum TaxID=119954 RepID=A0ACB9M570_9MYRT|nr:hypothetical protein MLD38_032948 [Melastoma candidum]
MREEAMTIYTWEEIGINVTRSPSSSSAAAPDASPEGSWSRVSGFGYKDGLGSVVSSFDLPAPWFIYSLIGIGIVLCGISFTGYITVEALDGCCLCFMLLLWHLLQLIIAGNSKADICKSIGITVLVVQGLALLVAFVLRGLASPQRTDFDYEDRRDGRARIRKPLLNPRTVPAQNSVKGDDRSARSDSWSSFVREKK